MRVSFGACIIELVQGDITRQPVDAIVNAANAALAGGGGVDGAIHRAGGPALKRETDERYPDGCPIGSAVETSGGEIGCRHVFHAVGPRWRGGIEGERELLQGAYRTALSLAIEHQCRSIAFPAISTGAYGYPLDLAAEHALAAVCEFVQTEGRPALVRFVLFDAAAYGAFARVLEGMSE